MQRGVSMYRLMFEGGPRGGTSDLVDDMNHVTVLYPGYTPASQETDAGSGDVVTALEWSGTEVDEVAYGAPALNNLQQSSSHDHSEDDVDSEHVMTEEQAAQQAEETPVEEDSTPEVTPEAPAAPQASETAPEATQTQQTAGPSAPLPPTPPAPPAAP